MALAGPAGQPVERACFGSRANAVSPGWFATEISEDFPESEARQAMLKALPMRRAGPLPRFDGQLLLLTSDAGGSITGSNVTVNGGHLLGSL